MYEEWIATSVEDLAMVLLSAFVIYVGVILCTRIAGLRSFAQISSFDFAMTIAVGSLITNTIVSKDPPLFQALTALVAIYGLQKLVAVLRHRGLLGHLVDNHPILLVKDGELLNENMKKANVTADDLRSRLRNADVHQLSEVRAVVMEMTGKISVLRSGGKDDVLDPWILEDVFGRDRFDFPSSDEDS